MHENTQAAISNLTTEKQEKQIKIESLEYELEKSKVLCNEKDILLSDSKLTILQSHDNLEMSQLMFKEQISEYNQKLKDTGKQSNTKDIDLLKVTESYEKQLEELRDRNLDNLANQNKIYVEREK